MTMRLSSDGRMLTIRVPMRFERRGGRKVIMAPVGSDNWQPPKPHIDNTLVRALARAHCWSRMLESGAYRSLAELAETEKINGSYLSRMLRLTLLAPDIVEVILDGRQPREMTLADLMRPLPVEWVKQRAFLELHA